MVVVLVVVIVLLGVVVEVVRTKILKSLSILSKEVFSFIDDNPKEEIPRNDSFLN